MLVKHMIEILRMLPADASVVVFTTYDAGHGLEIYEPEELRLATPEEDGAARRDVRAFSDAEIVVIR